MFWTFGEMATFQDGDDDEQLVGLGDHGRGRRPVGGGPGSYRHSRRRSSPLPPSNQARRPRAPGMLEDKG